MTRLTYGAALAIVLVLTAAVSAHEGHPHKVMGTVSALHENHLEVKAVDGKSVSVTLNAKTRVLRGKTKVPAGDIQPGERVVVTGMETKQKDGTTKLVATEVRLPNRDAGTGK